MIHSFIAIDLKPFPSCHPALRDSAAQFAPFAALTGHETAVGETLPC